MRLIRELRAEIDRLKVLLQAHGQVCKLQGICAIFGGQVENHDSYFSNPVKYQTGIKFCVVAERKCSYLEGLGNCVCPNYRYLKFSLLMEKECNK